MSTTIIHNPKAQLKKTVKNGKITRYSKQKIDV